MESAEDSGADSDLNGRLPSALCRSSFNTSNVMFIKEVQGQPILWDANHPDHPNRLARVEAWETIFRKYDKNWDAKAPDDKNEAITNLQRKWKNLRDGYAREVKLRLKGGRGKTMSGRDRKPYTYYNVMRFLSRGEKRKAEEPEDDDADLQEQDSSGGFHYAGPPTVVKTEPLEELDNDDSIQPTRRAEGVDPLLNVLFEEGESAAGKRRKCLMVFQRGRNCEDDEDVTEEETTRRKTVADQPNEDRLFMLSMLSDMKKVEDDFKLDMKVDIINVIKKYKNLSKRPR